MLRSMYSGVAGMKGFQAKLDVVGNNIANVNTVGFKKSRTTFQDLISQTSSAASGPTATRGGVNPKQVGTGSRIGSIDVSHTQGFVQQSNNPLDLMVEGDGMFAVITTDGSTAYTRAGNFYLSNDSAVTDGSMVNLVTVDGFKIQDITGAKISIPKAATSLSIQKDGSVTYVLPPTVAPDGTVTPAPAPTFQKIGLAVIPNPGGLEKIGGNLYLNTANTGYIVPANRALSTPETPGAGSITAGSLEMSNVDLAEEFTEMITAQRGFQANTRIITTSDEILQELVNLKR